jgi:hypothetical protein
MTPTSYEEEGMEEPTEQAVLQHIAASKRQFLAEGLSLGVMSMLKLVVLLASVTTHAKPSV